jgi:cysteine desulfurase/selenocysteine lyase
MIPAPSVMTTVAPFAPAAPGIGPPSVPPTTIPSYVPTPNVSVPLISHPPAGPPGFSDLPQPGASQGSFNPSGVDPSGQNAANLAQLPYRPDSPVWSATQPPDARASSPNAAFSVPGGAAHVPSDIPYFLAEMPSSDALPGQPASAPAPDLPHNLHPAIAAALAPVAPPERVPDPSMTTIPSYIPTPPVQWSGLPDASATMPPYVPTPPPAQASGLPDASATMPSYVPTSPAQAGRVPDASTSIPSYDPMPTAQTPVLQPSPGETGTQDLPQSGASREPYSSSAIDPSGLTQTNRAARLHRTDGSVARAPQSLDAPPFGAGAPSFQPGGAIPAHADALYFLGDTFAATPRAQPMSTAPLDPKLQPIDVRPENVPQLGRQFHPFDPYFVRRDFPILQERINGRPLVWLDNAATTQKPQAVIDRLAYFYAHENSNVHRGAHTLAARATDAYENAREKVQRFLGAASPEEIVFLRGTTEAINLVAQAWGRRNVQKDDEIVITWLEHHANIVPWQLLCAEKGARLRVAPIDASGQVMLDEYEKLLGPRTRIVAFSQVSNALGTVTPAREMVAMAHRHGARVLVDGAQAISHMPVDVQTLDCDFYVFSGHKIFGPTGIGALYGKSDVLNAMPPWQGGGSMIADVTFEKTKYQDAPARFEAGTGSIADAVGLGAALDYVSAIGMETISQYEHGLLVYATERMLTVPGLKLIGTAKEKASVLSFVLDEWRSEDVGQALDREGIAVRAGHHCAQPALSRFGLQGTVRPSLAFYNTFDDVDALVAALLRLQSGRHHRAGSKATIASS